MGSGTGTVTATAGPGITCTAGVFTNISDIDFQLASNTLQFTSNGKIFCFALTGSNTILLTASGDVYTLTVS